MSLSLSPTNSTHLQPLTHAPLTHNPPEANSTNKKINNFIIILFKSLAIASGFTLGFLTGLTVTAGSVSPIGLMIAGGIIVGCLTGNLIFGGKKELLMTLGSVVGGFGFGFFLAGIGGALRSEQIAINAGVAAGLSGHALVTSVNAATAPITWVIYPAFASFLLTPLALISFANPNCISAS